MGRPAAGPAGIAAGRSGVCSTLQLRPVPGSPTVVRGPPLRLTGMLNEAPLPPTEIELNPPLAKLKRSGPRRAERRKRKPMAISGLARRDGPSRNQVAVRMQQSANPCAQCIEPSDLQTSEEEGSASKALH
ncbi:hypothetical protein LBMAG41_27040 [Cyanobium sp.]|nr:hypothetical protein LBMAG41_27040 [Cyanobium sp.]